MHSRRCHSLQPVTFRQYNASVSAGGFRTLAADWQATGAGAHRACNEWANSHGSTDRERSYHGMQVTISPDIHRGNGSGNGRGSGNGDSGILETVTGTACSSNDPDGYRKMTTAPGHQQEVDLFSMD